MDIDTLKARIKDLEQVEKVIDQKVNEAVQQAAPNYMQIQKWRDEKKEIQKQIKYIQEKLIPNIIA